MSGRLLPGEKDIVRFLAMALADDAQFQRVRSAAWVLVGIVRVNHLCVVARRWRRRFCREGEG